MRQEEQMTHRVAKVTFGALNLNIGNIRQARGEDDKGAGQSLFKCHLRVVVRELDINSELASFVRTALRTWYCAFPQVQIRIRDEPELDRAQLGLVLLKVGQLAANALQGHLVSWNMRNSRINRVIRKRRMLRGKQSLRCVGRTWFDGGMMSSGCTCNKFRNWL